MRTCHIDHPRHYNNHTGNREPALALALKAVEPYVPNAPYGHISLRRLSEKTANTTFTTFAMSDQLLEQVRDAVEAQIVWFNTVTTLGSC